MDDLALGFLLGVFLWIFLTATFAYLTFFGIYIVKWKTLSSCPFLISPKDKVPLKFSRRDAICKSFESTMWINNVLEGLFFCKDSVLTKYAYRKILTMINSKTSKGFGSFLDGLVLNGFSYQGPWPTIDGIETKINEEKTSIAMVVQFSLLGSLEFDADVLSRGVYQIFKLQFSLRRFSGKFAIVFQVKDSPSILLSCSSLPEITLSLDYGERSLSRIANLSVLVIKSVVNAHLTYPRFVPLLLRTSREPDQTLIYVPFSLFNSHFLQISQLCIALPSLTIEDTTSIYCQLTFNGHKLRTDHIQTTEVLKWKKALSFPISSPVSDIEEEVMLQIKIYSKRKRLGNSSILTDSLATPISTFVSGKIEHHKLSFNPVGGGFLEFDAVVITDNWLTSILPEGLEGFNAPVDMSNKYLDGLNWSNLKIALEAVVSSSKPNLSAISINESLGSPIEPSKRVNLLRSYEDKLVESLKFLAGNQPTVSENSSDHVQNTNKSLFQIQLSLEAFRAEILRLIKSELEHGESEENIKQLLQPFLASLYKKFAKLENEEMYEDVIVPIENHLKNMLSPPETTLSPSPLSSLPELDTDLAKPNLVLEPRLNLSAPILPGEPGNTDVLAVFEHTCHLGLLAVSMLLTDEKIIIDNIYQKKPEEYDCNVQVMSLAESYGKDLTLQAIQSHQFVKKWNLAISKRRLAVSTLATPKYFPVVCTTLEKILRLRFVDNSKEKQFGLPKASYIELEYLVDEDTKSIDNLKFYAEGQICEQLYDVLQAHFLFHDAQMQAEIFWNSIEKVELVGNQIHLFFETVVGQVRTVECFKLSNFFGSNDIHSAYCELNSKVYQSKHPETAKFLSPTLGSVNSSSSSLSSLSNAVSTAKKPRFFQLSRVFHQMALGKNDEAIYNLFGIQCEKEKIIDYSCSFFRRGLNIGRLYITPDFLCFNGKRNGVKTSKMIVSIQAVENIEYVVKWFSKGFEFKFEEVEDTVTVIMFAALPISYDYVCSISFLVSNEKVLQLVTSN